MLCMNKAVLQWLLFYVFVALVKYLILTSYLFDISRPLSLGEKNWKIETYYFKRTISVNVLL